jgi:hypothetical protein
MYKLRNNQNRSLIATMLRLQTQQDRNPTHLFRLGIKNSPLCECGEVGTLNHIIIFSCPQNNPHNIVILLTRLTAVNVPFPTSLGCLLAKRNTYRYLQSSVPVCSTNWHNHIESYSLCTYLLCATVVNPMYPCLLNNALIDP